MNPRVITASMLFNELDFTAARSSGPGGQNVNKVNSKISAKIRRYTFTNFKRRGEDDYSQEFIQSPDEGRHFDDILSRQTFTA